MKEKSLISSVDQHISSTLEVCHPLLQKWSAPLFGVDVNDKPDLFATCVAVLVDGKSYLITAAHAIYEIEKTGSAVHIGGRYILEVPSTFARTSIDGNDPLDIAVAEVGIDFVQNNSMAIVLESQLVKPWQFKRPHLRCMHGYPLTKNKPFKSVDVARRHVTTYAFTYAGALSPKKTFFHPTRSERSHIALVYGLGKNDQGIKVNPPKPKGMSGGGLWIIPDSFDPSKCYLGGVMIEQHGKLVISTKIHKAIKFIAKYF